MGDDLQNWVGRMQTQTDLCDPHRVERLAALLDDQTEWHEGVLPYLAHWIHFWTSATHTQLGEDGHPKRGGFIPPISLPRRMWAGSDLAFYEDITFNQALTQRSQILSVEPKTSRSGEEMIFVKVKHEITGEKNGRREETQHIVYRAAPASEAAPPPPPPRKTDQEIKSSQKVRFDPVMLFRFSALMFNAHRIHYDRDYALQEGYPGLVVHGPLLAICLLNHFLHVHPNVNIRHFGFRARSPLFDVSQPTLLCCSPSDALWAQDGQGHVVMTASLDVAR